MRYTWQQIGTHEAARWTAVLERCLSYDVYHLPEYHKLAEERGEGVALLHVVETEGKLAAIPLLKREIEGETKLRDATSVYGYVGPVTTVRTPEPEFAAVFGDSLAECLREERIVSVFTRLHPILDNAWLLDPSGTETPHVGSTVYIDLKLPPEEQWRRYTKGHRSEIKRARRERVEGVHDAEWRHLPEFIQQYRGTMERKKASCYYAFDRHYFDRLRAHLGDKVQLFVAKLAGKMIAGALFFICNATVQYHLAGTDEAHRRLAPSKLIIDAARIWAQEQGAKTLHLGGGVGSQEDSLFRFKYGFSRCLLPFRVWRHVANREAYDRLSAGRITDFFPAYRTV